MARKVIPRIGTCGVMLQNVFKTIDTGSEIPTIGYSFLRGKNTDGSYSNLLGNIGSGYVTMQGKN